MTRNSRILSVAATLAALMIATGAPTLAAPKSSRAAAAKAETPSPRAQSLDPAGNYSGYPDWARAAFGPRAGGSGGR
jgi:hypothetical protein